MLYSLQPEILQFCKRYSGFSGSLYSLEPSAAENFVLLFCSLELTDCGLQTLVLFPVVCRELSGHKVQALPLDTKFHYRHLEYMKHIS